MAKTTIQRVMPVAYGLYIFAIALWFIQDFYFDNKIHPSRALEATCMAVIGLCYVIGGTIMALGVVENVFYYLDEPKKVVAPPEPVPTILDYFRTNMIAISFVGDQYRDIGRFMGMQLPELPCEVYAISFYIYNSPQGTVGFTVDVKFSPFWTNFTMITAEEFFVLVNEDVSIMETIK